MSESWRRSNFSPRCRSKRSSKLLSGNRDRRGRGRGGARGHSPLSRCSRLRQRQISTRFVRSFGGDSEKCVRGQKNGGALCQMRRKEGRASEFCILRCGDQVAWRPSASAIVLVVAHEKSVAVSRRYKWARDGSLDNRKSETDAHPLGLFVNSHFGGRGCSVISPFPVRFRTHPSFYSAQLKGED